MCRFLNLDVSLYQGVIRAKLFQTAFCKCSTDVESSCSEKMFFFDKKLKLC